MDWLESYFDRSQIFVTPDWNAINEVVDKDYKDSDQHQLWCDIARTWLKKLIPSLSSEHRVHESENFLLLTSESSRYVSVLSGFLERTLGKILATLPGIARYEGFGKQVVIIFDDIDLYYGYLSDFYNEDGVFGLSSGVYVNRGYGHFVFPHQELSIAESIAAHEMTHALVSHLPIPAWLNEGIAVNIENLITGSAPLNMNDELFARHQSFWGEEEIQEFWSGDAFYRADQGQELSYQLAQYSVSSLSQNYIDFVSFTNAAHFSDGGEAAAIDVYGVSLGDLITQYFGEGNWEPTPKSWKKSTTSIQQKIR